jgi:hypothetical protein
MVKHLLRGVVHVFQVSVAAGDIRVLISTLSVQSAFITALKAVIIPITMMRVAIDRTSILPTSHGLGLLLMARTMPTAIVLGIRKYGTVSRIMQMVSMGNTSPTLTKPTGLLPLHEAN